MTVEINRQKIIEIFIGSLSLSVFFSFFLYWYRVGSTPLGWGAPHYIKGMLAIKRGERLLIDRGYFLYFLLGSVLSFLFQVRPYYIEIYLPLVLALVFILLWYRLSKKLFDDKMVAVLTLLFTTVWYSSFDLTIFRHTSLLSFTLLLLAFQFVPELSGQEPMSKKEMGGVWCAFFLGSLSHYFIANFLWGVLLVTALLPYVVGILPRFIREPLGMKDVMDPFRNRTALLRSVFLGTATLPPLVMGFLLRGASTATVKTSLATESPLNIYSSLLYEFFNAFGGFMVIFFVYGIYILLKRRQKQDHQPTFNERLFLVWIFVPLLLLPFSFFSSLFVIYLRRCFLSFPVPLVGAFGMKDLFMSVWAKLESYDLASVWQTKTARGVLTMGLILSPIVGTEYLIYRHYTPPHRYISSKTVHQLQWIGERTEQTAEPIFLFYTPPDTTFKVRAVDNWIKCYLNKFYIYPGSITMLLDLKEPRDIYGAAQKYFNEMEDDGILNDSELTQHTIYVLPKFYKQGNFNTSERALLIKAPKGIYRLNSSKISRRGEGSAVQISERFHSLRRKETSTVIVGHGVRPCPSGRGDNPRREERRKEGVSLGNKDEFTLR